MYKLTSNISLIETLNSLTKQHENNGNVAYCAINKHATLELYAIPIITSYLQAINAPNEVFENLVETLPDGWSWNFENRLIRVSIPFDLQVKAILANSKNEQNYLAYLGALVEGLKTQLSEFIVTDSTSIIVYLEFLLPEHKALLESFESIKIEYYETQG